MSETTAPFNQIGFVWRLRPGRVVEPTTKVAAMQRFADRWCRRNGCQAGTVTTIFRPYDSDSLDPIDHPPYSPDVPLFCVKFWVVESREPVISRADIDRLRARVPKVTWERIG